MKRQPPVSESRRSRRSKRLTYLECATNMDTTTQIRMKMKHLSSELFISWLQTGRRRNLCLLRAIKAKQLRLDAPLVPSEPIRASSLVSRPHVFSRSVKSSLGTRLPRQRLPQTSSAPPSRKRRSKAAERKERLPKKTIKFS